jgi:hypothetical protein
MSNAFRIGAWVAPRDVPSDAAEYDYGQILDVDELGVAIVRWERANAIYRDRLRDLRVLEEVGGGR